MRFQDWPQDAKAAVERIYDAIAAEATTVGPCSELARRERDDEDETEILPEGVILSEFIVLTAWTDQATGESWLSYVPSQGLPYHHQLGLLYQFLD